MRTYRRACEDYGQRAAAQHALEELTAKLKGMEEAIDGPDLVSAGRDIAQWRLLVAQSALTPTLQAIEMRLLITGHRLFSCHEELKALKERAAQAQQKISEARSAAMEMRSRVLEEGLLTKISGRLQVVDDILEALERVEMRFPET